jgi:hypothetical protein
LLGTGVAVGIGADVSEGAAVAVVALDGKKGSLQALMVMESRKAKDNNIAGLLNGFMSTSFLWRSLVNYTSKPPLWAACLYN